MKIFSRYNYFKSNVAKQLKELLKNISGNLELLFLQRESNIENDIVNRQDSVDKYMFFVDGLTDTTKNHSEYYFHMNNVDDFYTKSALSTYINNALFLTGNSLPCEDRIVMLSETLKKRSNVWNYTFLDLMQDNLTIDSKNSLISITPQLYFANRLLTFPEQDLNRCSIGLNSLGGLISTTEFASLTLHQWWVFASKNNSIIPILKTHNNRDQNLYSLCVDLSRSLGINVFVESDLNIPACFIRTKKRQSIYLAQDIPNNTMAFLVLHELAHVLLRHIEASSYIFDVHNRFIDLHEKQELEADAFATILQHQFSGLLDIVYRHSNCSEAIGKTFSMPESHSSGLKHFAETK